MVVKFSLGGVPYATAPIFGRQVSFVRQVFKAGVRDFDTAQLYGHGRGEEIIGRALRKSQVSCVVTKIGVPYPGQKIFTDDGNYKTLSLEELSQLNQRAEQFANFFPPTALKFSLFESLGRLNTTSIRGLLLHSVPVGLDLNRWVDSLRALKSDGLVEEIGLSIDDDCSPASIDLSWADIVQVSLKSLLAHPSLRFRPKQEVQVNRIFGGERRSVLEAAQCLAPFSATSAVLLGTRKLWRVKAGLSSLAGL